MAEKISESNVKFILNEIPKLLTLGLINDEYKEKLENYYLSQLDDKKVSKNKILTLVLISIGALLVGLGSCLIIAHNWDKFNTLTRLCMAFIPLFLNSFFVLYSFNKSEVLRESATIIQSAAIAGSIAIVAQVYNLGGTIFDFLQIWFILTIPFVLLLRSKLGVLILSAIYFFYLINFSIFSKNSIVASSLFFIPFGLLLYNIITEKVKNLMIIFQIFTLALMAQYLIIFAPKGDITSALFPLAVSGIFVLGCELKEKHKFITNIFMVGGYIALFWILLIYSNPDVNLTTSKTGISINNIGWLILVGIGLIYTAYTAIKRKNGFYFAPIVMCIIITLYVISHDAEIIMKFMLLIFGGLVGVYGIFHACKSKSMLGLNAAVILVVGLIFNYFFSKDLSIIARGVAFIITGIGFIALNTIVNKKFKNTAKEA